jgi:hypothetical protein
VGPCSPEPGRSTEKTWLLRRGVLQAPHGLYQAPAMTSEKASLGRPAAHARNSPAVILCFKRLSNVIAATTSAHASARLLAFTISTPTYTSPPISRNFRDMAAMPASFSFCLAA